MSSLTKATFFKLFKIMYLGSILVQLAPVTYNQFVSTNFSLAPTVNYRSLFVMS